MEFGTGREVEPPCSRQDIHDLIIGVAAIRARRSQSLQHERVTQPARMGQQVADRDPVPMVGTFRNVLSYVIVQRDLTALCEERNTHRGELLGYGGRGKDGCRREGDAQFEAGHAVAALVHRDSPLADGEAAARRVRPIPFRKQSVDSRATRLGWRSIAFGAETHARPRVCTYTDHTAVWR